MQQALPSVNLNQIQGNPYQPNLTYRGFTASPLLGEPQGLSVFQDGVRVNQPFGDVVSWDLIPQFAISTVNLIPGSDPLYGLNTLGGALSMRTKSGRYYPNTELEAYAGSWGRWSVTAEHGGLIGDNKDYYFGGTWFQEDGWRDYSPSKVGQLFGKVGFDDGTTSLNLSLTFADTDLTGNGVAPQSMLDQRWEQVFTVPDNTKNQMGMLALSGSHWLNDRNQLSGLVYYRNIDTNTLNGDANDEFEDSANDGETGRQRRARVRCGHRRQQPHEDQSVGLRPGAAMDQRPAAQPADAGRLVRRRPRRLHADLGAGRVQRQPLRAADLAGRAGELAVRNDQHLEPVRDRHLQDHAQAVPDLVGALQQHPRSRPRTA